MTTSHARLHHPAAGGAGALRPGAPPAAESRRRSAAVREGTWRQVRAAEALHTEEDRMRLVAALLVLATLLLWILFLQG